jgi:uncharacterized membrane protein YhaH (DUF805 family)
LAPVLRFFGPALSGDAHTSRKGACYQLQEHVMQTADPYRPPEAHVADTPSSGVSKVRFWSAKGRMGRVRYIGYSIGLAIVINSLLGFLAASLSDEAGEIITFFGLGLALFVYGLLSIQRAHDFNISGWLAILAFVPLFNFVFWVVPGTGGDNRFGCRTPPNTVASVVLACLIPFLIIAGIVVVTIAGYHRHELPDRSVQTK